MPNRNSQLVATKNFKNFNRKYTDNKSYCEDLTEGKFSFPIIHGIKSDPTDSRIYSTYKTHNRK